MIPVCSATTSFTKLKIKTGFVTLRVLLVTVDVQAFVMVNRISAKVSAVFIGS